MRLPALLLAVVAVASCVPALSLAQNSATAAVTHAASAASPLTPGGVSAVLTAANDRNGQPHFLTADQAFQVSASAAGPDSVRLDWQITDGYYLYRSRIHVKTASPAQLGALALPEGKSQTDEYFGTQQIYEQDRKSTRLNSSHERRSRMPSSA